MKTAQTRKTITEKSSIRRPIVVAGPCSAESPEQLMKTATILAATGRVDYFRAGIWKPRTAPGSFEGMGTKALRWLQQVKQTTGLHISTEVASVKHVEEALKHNVDMLWIGARTVSNPFLVQDIADTLRGTDVRVMVKNPMAPDPDLWSGSIERFKKAGLKDICAIHRGFSYWTKSLFRNQPLWHIPMTLKERMPDVPVLCDPSHITGDRHLVPMVAHRSLEMGMDGLMVEVHPQPANALSDASQQLTPVAFVRLIKQLFGENAREDKAASNILEELRAEVDVMDDLLIWALTNRMKLSGEIAGVKTTHNMKTLQPERWKQVISKVLTKARIAGLRQGFIEKLFDDIHHESLSVQQTSNTRPQNNSQIHPTFAI